MSYTDQEMTDATGTDPTGEHSKKRKAFMESHKKHKSLYNSVKDWIVLKISKLIVRAFLTLDTFHNEIFESVIKQLYQGLAIREDFLLRSEIIGVKKGKRRYKLLIVETKAGIMKYHIGRNTEAEIVDESDGKPGYFPKKLQPLKKVS